jgi:fumarate reductase iron-sulfur subunit
VLKIRLRNTGKWMRVMSVRLQTWVQAHQDLPELTRLEARMDAALADQLCALDGGVE